VVHNEKGGHYQSRGHGHGHQGGQQQDVSERDIEEIEARGWLGAFHRVMASEHTKSADYNTYLADHYDSKASEHRRKAVAYTHNTEPGAVYHSAVDQNNAKAKDHDTRAAHYRSEAAKHTSKAAEHSAKARAHKRSTSPGRRGHGHGEHGHVYGQVHHGSQQQEVSERDFGELAEEIEARSFDEPVDIDLMIRELGNSDEDGVYF
jgi:hypothetical protein